MGASQKRVFIFWRILHTPAGEDPGQFWTYIRFEQRAGFLRGGGKVAWFLRYARSLAFHSRVHFHLWSTLATDICAPGDPLAVRIILGCWCHGPLDGGCEHGIWEKRHLWARLQQRVHLRNTCSYFDASYIQLLGRTQGSLYIYTIWIKGRVFWGPGHDFEVCSKFGIP